MENTPNILLTGDVIDTSIPAYGSGLRFMVHTYMGTHSDDDATGQHDDAAATAAGLRRLSGAELEACVLHLVDGWPQPTVARWLGVSRRTVQLLLVSAARKAPALRTLWSRTNAAPPPRRPRVLHLSQLGVSEHGPFDADDL